MKLALCSRSFETSFSHGEMLISDLLQIARKLGLLGIDLSATHVRDLQSAHDYRKLISQQGLSVVSYSTRLLAISVEDSGLQPFEEEFRKAAALGSPYIGIRTNLGNEYKSESVASKRVITGYQRLVELARRYSVIILVENVKGISSTPAGIQSIVTQFQPYVYACLDTGNFPSNRRYSDNLAVLPWAKHCHFKTLDFDVDGFESTIDAKMCVIELVRTGYDGFVAIEYEGTGNERQAAELSVALVRRLLHDVGQC